MKLRLTTGENYSGDASFGDVRAAMSSEGYFWLDVEDPGAEVTELSSIFGVDAAILDEINHIRQRARLDNVGAATRMVAFAVTGPDGGMTEVHCLFAERWLLTLHRKPCSVLEDLFDDPVMRQEIRQGHPIASMYRVLVNMFATFQPAIEHIDDKLTRLESAVFKDPTPDQLRTLARLKRKLGRMRRVLAPHRDRLVGGVGRVIDEIPGIDDDGRRYFRDLYDLLVHITDQIDAERDHATEVMDVYLSIINNRQNAVMKQLTVVATIFLPLMFISSFFGQNFFWMTSHITELHSFLIWGLGLNLVSVMGLLIWMRRHGWE